MNTTITRFAFVLALVACFSFASQAQTHVIDQIRGSVDIADEEEDVIRNHGQTYEGEELEEEIVLDGNPPRSEILIDLSGLKDPEDALLYELTPSPNPAVDVITANLILPRAGKGTIQIYDLRGRLVTETNHILKAGKSEITVEISNLQSGAYIMHWQDENYGVSTRFIKG